MFLAVQRMLASSSLSTIVLSTSSALGCCHLLCFPFYLFTLSSFPRLFSFVGACVVVQRYWARRSPSSGGHCPKRICQRQWVESTGFEVDQLPHSGRRRDCSRRRAGECNEYTNTQVSSISPNSIFFSVGVTQITSFTFTLTLYANFSSFN